MVGSFLSTIHLLNFRDKFTEFKKSRQLFPIELAEERQDSNTLKLVCEHEDRRLEFFIEGAQFSFIKCENGTCDSKKEVSDYSKLDSLLSWLM